MSAFFEPGRNCWRVEAADRASVLIDGENYFRAVREAMAQARSRIVLVGWDFDARLEMHDTEEEPEGPLEIGRYIDWLIERNRDLEIYVLRWDYGALRTLWRGRTLLTTIRWLLHPRIHIVLDQRHPVGAAQHQKIVVVDDDTAFCGGIDMTEHRWDTRAHEAEHEYRRQPDDEDAGPWHDASMVVQGPVASALAEFCERRWNEASRREMRAVGSSGDAWPAGLTADFRDVDIAIARSQAELDDHPRITEIESLYEDLIDRAERHVYIESQYFTSCKIASALARRLDEDDGPEIVIVNPETADGWLESKVMDTTRAKLVAALRERDRHDRFRVFHPVGEQDTAIYVHAKIAVIDDRLLRIGSSNLNNRSLGFDSECDLAIDAKDDPQVRSEIGRIRNDLLAEHLGVEIAEIEHALAESGSLIDTIRRCRRDGRSLRDYALPDLDMAEESLAESDILDPERADDAIASLDVPW